MTSPNVLILIPARFASTRFPGKPLALIAGKSLIQRVYENCAESGFDLAVVTDDDRIEKHVHDFGGKIARVDDDLSSGSERIFAAFERFYKGNGKYDLLINVQGDEPLLKGKLLKQLADFHWNSSYDIATMVRPRKEKSDEVAWQDPNVVKVIFDQNSGACHYFSRASIPYVRGAAQAAMPPIWYQHIGVYSYRPAALQKFFATSQDVYENLEKLEQLRALSAGMRLGALAIEDILYGVDTPGDIEKVEGVLCGKR